MFAQKYQPVKLCDIQILKAPSVNLACKFSSFSELTLARRIKFEINAKWGNWIKYSVFQGKFQVCEDMIVRETHAGDRNLSLTLLVEMKRNNYLMYFFYTETCFRTTWCRHASSRCKPVTKRWWVCIHYALHFLHTINSSPSTHVTNSFRGVMVK